MIDELYDACHDGEKEEGGKQGGVLDILKLITESNVVNTEKYILQGVPCSPASLK